MRVSVENVPRITWRKIVVGSAIVMLVGGIALSSYGYIIGNEQVVTAGDTIWAVVLFIAFLGGLGYLIGRLDRTRTGMQRRLDEIGDHVTRINTVTDPLPAEVKQLKADLVTELKANREWVSRASERLAAIEGALPDADVHHLHSRSETRENEEL